MAHRLSYSYCLLVCWLVVTVAEGQEGVVTPPGDSQHNADPTDCQIFTLTPPPTTRKPVTRIQPITRTPRCPLHFFPPRCPRVHLRFPYRPFHPPTCNHRFQIHPFFWPHRRLPPHYRYFPRRPLWRGSSSEESRAKREAPNILKEKKPMMRRVKLSGRAHAQHA
ncbi:odontogenesis associated phosphoprotein [Camelus dromedarius]|uniref:Odontogenesis associated phosphoprotein n=4 Tax=Camelus TaxID=9836 RepID=A0A8B7K6N0_CAMFR|nr:odontogenesis associated phosphoprotein [Camelus bactrianus]XP_010982087.1 odontogenesis associated phosphoprotein [Camelus dromedarius]XP_014407528.1 odontogenesis associated phosphoprotein [Camelus ferus]